MRTLSTHTQPEPFHNPLIGFEHNKHITHTMQQQLTLRSSSQCASTRQHSTRHHRCQPFTPGKRSNRASASTTRSSTSTSTTNVSRRQQLSAALLSAVALQIGSAFQGAAPAQAQSLDDDFTVTPSGLKVLDVRPGEGASPQPGDRVAVHWSGYTKGYQVRL